MPPDVWARVISAAVVPVVMISACGLLCLAFYNRLSAVMNRLRALQHQALEEQEELAARPSPSESQRIAHAFSREEVVIFHRQAVELLHRARLLQRTLFALLASIAALVLCSLAAGLGVFWLPLLYVAGPLFLLGQGGIFAAVVIAGMELRIALDPVEMEQKLVRRLGEKLIAPESGGAGGI